MVKINSVISKGFVVQKTKICMESRHTHELFNPIKYTAVISQPLFSATERTSFLFQGICEHMDVTIHKTAIFQYK